MNLGRCSALVVLIGIWLLSLGICLPPFMLQKLHYQLCTFINDLWYVVLGTRKTYVRNKEFPSL